MLWCESCKSELSIFIAGYKDRMCYYCGGPRTERIEQVRVAIETPSFEIKPDRIIMLDDLIDDEMTGCPNYEDDDDYNGALD